MRREIDETDLRLCFTVDFSIKYAKPWRYSAIKLVPWCYVRRFVFFHITFWVFRVYLYLLYLFIKCDFSPAGFCLDQTSDNNVGEVAA